MTVMACPRSMATFIRYIMASTNPQATLQPRAAQSNSRTSSRASVLALMAPVNDNTIMSPNNTSAIRSTGVSTADSLTLLGGGARHPATELTIHEGKHFVQMDGKAVFRFATRVMGTATKEAMERAGMKLEEVDLIIPHQANYRIIETAAKYLKLPLDKFMINVDRYGNTSTASIPIATVEAFEKGRIKSGSKVVFVGFGAGLTWGSIVLKMVRGQNE